MIAAEILLEYPSVQVARSILDALDPDNRAGKDKNNQIIARLRGRKLQVQITKCPRIETMQASLQDILRCVKAAEQSIAMLDSGVLKRRLTPSRKRKKDKRFK